MPTPSPRIKFKVARGDYANLFSSLADLEEGELCYARDQDTLYVKEGGDLVHAGLSYGQELSDYIRQTITKEIIQDDAALLLEGGEHSGISFVYDDVGNKINASVNVLSVNGQTGDVVVTVPVTSVNGQTGSVVVTAPVTSVNGQTGDVSIAVPVTSVNGQTGDIVITPPVTSVNGQTGSVSLDLLQESDIPPVVYPLLTGGSHNGISFQWNAATSRIDATVNEIAPSIVRGSANLSCLLAAGATDTFIVTLPRSCLIYKISLNKAAWIRLYNSDSSSLSDASRGRGTDPSGASGVICEVISTGEQSFALSPIPSAMNNQVTINNQYPVRVTNDSASANITISIDYLELES